MDADLLDGKEATAFLQTNYTANGTLLTMEKNDIIKMVNELFQNVDNGKNDVYSAIIGKGTTPTSKDFSALVAGINAISTRKK